jgi:hypothetical protein
MTHANTIFHLVRASFLERVRRRNFVVVLFGVTLLSLAIATGRLILRLDVYIGEYNSAWVGALVAGSTTVLLCFANFFIIKNTIECDRITGVGELVASTPMNKVTYLLGKVFGNFAVLMAIEGCLFISAILVQLVHGDPQIDILALLLPFLFIALPAMAAISALALIFETIPGLRSGLGNLIFVFLWFAMTFRIAAYDEEWFDLPGLIYVDRVFSETARKMEIPFEGGFSIEGGMMADPFAQNIRWENVSWINEMIGWRLYWFGLSIGLTLLAAVFFDRFDPNHTFLGFINWPRRKISQEKILSHKIERFDTHRENLPVREITFEGILHPIRKLSGLFHFCRIFWVETRMILKQPWWWYLISLWLLVMSLLTSVTEAHTFWVPLIWLWISFPLSGIGIRDSRFNTEQIVFSAPNPLRHHFFATWLAGITFTIFMGIAGARLFINGEADAALAWGIAALFIPSLALATGILCGNRRLFEGLYIAWWLMGPMASEGTGLDFIGVHQDIVARGVHWAYLIATLFLLAIAFLGRWRQLRSV